jgi:hypothetical protein
VLFVCPISSECISEYRRSVSVSVSVSVCVSVCVSVFPVDLHKTQCSRNPLTCSRINWDGKLSGYAENPDNWIFL